MSIEMELGDGGTVIGGKKEEKSGGSGSVSDGGGDGWTGVDLQPAGGVGAATVLCAKNEARLLTNMAMFE